MIGLDTEDTGVDFFHGAKPYLVTIYEEDGNQVYWEWDVDPLTREPQIPEEDIDEIEEYLEGQEFVLQNPKFDVRALQTIKKSIGENWDWDNTYDTLLAAHLLASNEPKDLITLAVKYLGVNIQPFEEGIKEATKKARNFCRRKDFIKRHGEWALAKKGRPDMPSAKGEAWKHDMWLPRAVAKAEGYEEDHPWWSVLADYANADSSVTLPIYQVQEQLIKERGLWEIYLERLKVLPIIYEMEEGGLTANWDRHRELMEEFQSKSKESEQVCVEIANKKGYELKLPKSGNNGSLLSFCFEELQLPVLKWTEKGNPSLDQSAIDDYKATLEGEQLEFINHLADKRKRDTSINYMESYEKYKTLIKGQWYSLHSSLNQTGSDTLRFSSSSPNSQQVGKQDDVNLRYIFGPLPGYEWWALDYENLEITIPAYVADEKKIIELLEKPNDPPYFGSFHLLIFSILHPDKWDQDDPEGLLKAKDKYKATWYQWTKNGDFAVQYGAVEESGTADAAYHLPGAQRKIKSHLSNIEKLNQKMINMANRQGYVETLPDKTVNPKKGYPLLCTRSKRGKVKPTVPLNYFIQGTAMWAMIKSMIRCHNYLKKIGVGRIVMQVHDELVFELPKGGKKNLKLVNRLKKLMEESGNDIGIPLRVSKSCHPNNWAEEGKL